MSAERVPFDEYAMMLAQAASTRGTCDRKRVGAVLVVDRRIIATGYNGALPGESHCDEVGHDLVDTLLSDGTTAPNCVRTVHAESNAVAQAARHGVRTEGATCYTNTFPCWPCFRLLAAAGVHRIVCADVYRRDERVDNTAKRMGILIDVL